MPETRPSLGMISYQEAVSDTMFGIRPLEDFDVVYNALGLSNEAGEILGVLKKAMRDTGGVLSPAQRRHLIEEIGDSLWYLTALCESLGTDLESVARFNISKIRHLQKQRNRPESDKQIEQAIRPRRWQG